MRKQCFLFCCVVFVGLSGCAQLSTQSPPPQMGNLLLVEPAPVNPRSELLIARYNQILSLAELKDDEKAELLYQRGNLYDSVGLSGLAKLDYTRALELKPNLAPAYNSIGIHFVQQNDFIQAFDAFDSTLDIDPNYHFAYLNRGIALYYGGRAELAVDDLTRFASLDTSDPFRVLWAFFAHHDVSPQQGREYLQQSKTGLHETHWATGLIDLFLGVKTEKEVLTGLIDGVQSNRQLTDRLCEAYFYLGKYHQMANRKGAASNYFKLTLSTNVYDYVEHKYARKELSRLRTPESEPKQITP